MGGLFHARIEGAGDVSQQGTLIPGAERGESGERNTNIRGDPGENELAAACVCYGIDKRAFLPRVVRCVVNPQGVWEMTGDLREDFGGGWGEWRP